MSAAVGDTPIVIFPPEDGAVASTLAELKTKLTAWTAAVSDVHEKFAESAERLTQAERATQGEEEHETPVVEGAGDPVPAASEGDSADEDAALLSSLDPAMAQLIRIRYRLFRGRKGIQELVADEEEALLNSLEPEAAKAVRVEHRLFNGRKSALRLIEEYEGRPKAEGEKATWWKRVTR